MSEATSAMTAEKETIEPDKQKIELLIQKGIRHKEDDVVKAIVKALDESKYPRKDERNRKMPLSLGTWYVLPMKLRV